MARVSTVNYECSWQKYPKQRYYLRQVYAMRLFLFSIFLFIRLGSFKVETGLSLSVAPASVRYIREKRTSDSCWGVSHTSKNKLLCAVNRGIEIRSLGLQLDRRSTCQVNSIQLSS